MDELEKREHALLEAIDTGRLESDDPELHATIATYQKLETLLERWSLPSEVTAKLEADGGILPDLEGYQIQREIGRGGFGRVYLARDCRLNRNVALKIPTWERLLTHDHVERVLTEARLTASLRHPGIVSVYDVRHVSGQVVIISEYVDGASLEEQLGDGELGPLEAVERLREVADALAHVHQRGIVHGDLKPANILVERDGRARITDFGLGVDDTHRLFGDMKGGGTLHYMAPEQLRGADYLDGRVDIWAFGVILYRVLTGHLPFAGNDRDDVIHAIRHKNPKPPRQINPKIAPDLERVCLKCLEKNPADRYPSATDLSRALQPATISGSSLLKRGAIILALAAILLFGVFRQPRQTASHAGQPRISAEAITVERFSFERGTSDQARAQAGGIIGLASAVAHLDEDVAIEISLDRPLHFYLIALNPDGTTELCWPQDAETVPPSVTRAICPSDKEVYGLTEGTGAQVFVLFANVNPLPAYAEWRSIHGKIPWPETTGYAGGVWFFDKQRGYRPSMFDNPRVSRRSRMTPEPFVAACEFFAEKTPWENVAAVLFPVVDP